MKEELRLQKVEQHKDRLHNVCPICNEILPLSVVEHCGVKAWCPYTVTYRLDTLLIKDELR